MKRKTFKIIMGVKSPDKGYPFRGMLLDFIRRRLKDDYAYHHPRHPAHCYNLGPIKFVKTALPYDNYYLSYKSIQSYYSPYFIITDVRYYEKEI